MSHVVRKPVFTCFENKAADQLHGNHAAEQHLSFRYIGSTNALLSRDVSYCNCRIESITLVWRL